MSDVAVDSSVVAKRIIAEPDSAQAQRLISEVALKGERLIVLDLAFVEVANAIWKLRHRGLATLDQTRLFLDKLLLIPVHIEPAHRLLKPALEIAVKYHRAVYDALFVALCQDLGLRGVTADEPLHNVVHADFPKSFCCGTSRAETCCDRVSRLRYALRPPAFRLMGPDRPTSVTGPSSRDPATSRASLPTIPLPERLLRNKRGRAAV